MKAMIIKGEKNSILVCKRNNEGETCIKDRGTTAGAVDNEEEEAGRLHRRRSQAARRSRPIQTHISSPTSDLERPAGPVSSCCTSHASNRTNREILDEFQDTVMVGARTPRLLYGYVPI